jgi:hypothetical protein
MRVMVAFVFLFCVSTLCAPLVAHGEEQPCRAHGATVVCQRAGFDALVGKLLDAKEASAKCALASESQAADAEVLKARLAFAAAERDKALSDLAVAKAKPFPTRTMLEAVGLGAVSGLAGSFALSASSEVATASLFSVAFASAATAVALVLWE